jgi:hypothetical protein
MKNNPVQNIIREVLTSSVAASQVLLVGSILGIGFVGATPAQAATFTYSGDTTGAPTWSRPGSGAPPTSVSGSSGYGYQVLEFNIDTSGTYDFLSTTTTWDSYTFLYRDSFNPTAQLTNVIIGNDDFPTTRLSGFNGVSLSAGTNYFFVTSSFSTGGSGTYTNTITGPGNVSTATAAPEPFTIIGTLVGGTAAMRMRKKLKSVNKG